MVTDTNTAEKIIARLAQQLAQLGQQRTDIEAGILAVVDAQSLTQILTSMPGVGARTAESNTTRDQLIGLCPSLRRSVRRDTPPHRQHRRSDSMLSNPFQAEAIEPCERGYAWATKAARQGSVA